MKYFVIVILFIASYTHGFEEYICKSSSGKEAMFKVSQKVQNSEMLCEVIYVFNGVETTVFSDVKELESCEDKASDLIAVHRDRWGWKCQSLVEYMKIEPTDVLISQLDPIVQKEISEYQKAAIVQGMISMVSPIRIMIQEYKLNYGEAPTSLEDLHLNKEDMRDSRYFSDLTIDSNGDIYISGNDEIGSDTVVRIGFKETMGGLNTEMVCHINKPIKRIKYCDYDSAVRFPL